VIIYQNYHNTGATHDIEYVFKGTACYFRLKWKPEDFKPLNLTGELDGDGHFWGEIKGRCKLRLRPVTDEDRWPGAEYPTAVKRAVVPSKPPSDLDPKTPTQKVPDPATSSPVRSAKEVFALSDLRDLEPDSPVQTDPMPRLQNGSTVEGS
jgi:hypothetical protein